MEYGRRDVAEERSHAYSEKVLTNILGALSKREISQYELILIHNISFDSYTRLAYVLLYTIILRCFKSKSVHQLIEIFINLNVYLKETRCEIPRGFLQGIIDPTQDWGLKDIELARRIRLAHLFAEQLISE